MNVNVKISLTDEERNTLYRRMTGKDVKRLISRKEVCELVNEYIAVLLSTQEPEAYRGNDYGDDEPDQADMNFCSDDCCRTNTLLRQRMNRLQHRLDTGR